MEDDFGACLELLSRLDSSVGVLPILDDPESRLVPEEYGEVFSFRPLEQDQVCLIVSRQSKLYQYKSVTYKLLRGGRFVIYAKNYVCSYLFHYMLITNRKVDCINENYRIHS